MGACTCPNSGCGPGIRYVQLTTRGSSARTGVAHVQHPVLNYIYPERKRDGPFLRDGVEIRSFDAKEGDSRGAGLSLNRTREGENNDGAGLRLPGSSEAMVSGGQ